MQKATQHVRIRAVTSLDNAHRYSAHDFFDAGPAPRARLHLVESSAPHGLGYAFEVLCWNFDLTKAKSSAPVRLVFDEGQLADQRFDRRFLTFEKLDVDSIRLEFGSMSTW